MQKQLRSLLCFFAAALIFGLTFVAQCNTGALEPGAFLAVRSLVAVLALCPVILLLERGHLFGGKTAATWRCGAVCGSVLFLASILQQAGIHLSHSAAKAGFITGLYIVLVPILSLLFWRKKTGIRLWLGAVCAFIGLYLLSMTGFHSDIEPGDLLVLLGSLFWALHILTIDRFIDRVYPIQFSAVQFLTCGILALLYSLIWENPALSAIPGAWTSILFCGVVASGGGYTLQILGQKHADPTLASIVLSTESIFSAVGGAVFLHEVMTPRSLAGCGLMFLGILLAQLPAKKRD